MAYLCSDELPRSISTCLPLEDLLLRTATVSLGLLLYEAWNTKPAVLDELGCQSTEAPIRVGFTLVDDIEDVFQNWTVLIT